MKPVYMLDACALIAYLSDEQGAKVVEDLLVQAANGIIVVIMHKINLLEVYYGIYRHCGKERAGEMLEDIAQSGIKLVDGFTAQGFLEAGRLKATYKVSLADAVVLGEALAQKATLLTADHHEFDAVELAEKILFSWIR